MNRFVSFLLMLFLMQPAFSLDYNYSSTKSVPIRMVITDEISTNNSVLEGTTVYFKVIDDVYVENKKVVTKGELLPGKIETIITSGMNGFPAEIIIDSIEIPGIKPSQLISTYTKCGQNRSLWVYPLKWSLTMIPFVGSLTNLIKGGHAKITPSDIITVYYYPDWK